MYSIKHLFHCSAPIDAVYNALTTLEGLQSWWTVHTAGNPEEGKLLEFNFPPNFFNTMQVVKLVPGNYVEWKCIKSAPEWINTSIKFSLDTNNNKTRIKFEHSNWKKDDDFYAQCSFSWGRYLESLRQYLEKGIGQPYQ